MVGGDHPSHPSSGSEPQATTKDAESLLHYIPLSKEENILFFRYLYFIMEIFSTLTTLNRPTL